MGIALTQRVVLLEEVGHEAVAEHALALLLALAKNAVLNDRRTHEGHWRAGLHIPPRGQTLGIGGLGRIGRSLAVRAKALGMEMDGRGFGLGMRGQRFAVVVNDGVATDVQVEAPKEVKVSSAENILSKL